MTGYIASNKKVRKAKLKNKTKKSKKKSRAKNNTNKALTNFSNLSIAWNRTHKTNSQRLVSAWNNLFSKGT